VLRKSTTSGTDLSEKEKAYAEARARIFNATAGGGAGSDAGDHDEGAGLDESAAPTSTPALAFAAAAAAALQTPLRSFYGPNSARGVDGPQAQGSSSASAAPPLAESKATYRNRVEEAADPDFKRGVGVALPLQHHHQPSATASYLQPHAAFYTGYPTPQLTTGYAPLGGPNGFASPTPSTTVAPPLSGNSGGSVTAAGVAPGPAAPARTSATPKLAADAPAFYPRWLAATAATPVAAPPQSPSTPAVGNDSGASANPAAAAAARRASEGSCPNRSGESSAPAADTATSSSSAGLAGETRQKGAVSPSPAQS
jgi:hypothetical protein